jgi:hypothetical protein
MYRDNRLISLNSKFAQYKNGTLKSNLIYKFSGILKDDDNIIQKYITILDCQIPCSFYVINSTNQVLTIVLGANTYTLIITNGNYNASSLITELKSKIATIPTLTATIVINKSTGKLTFTFSSSVTLVFGTSTSNSVIGLTSNLTGTNLTLQQPLNLLGIKKINVKSDALSVSSFSSKNLGISSIILSIPNNSAQFNLINYTNQNSLNNSILNADIIDIIDIQLVDEDGDFLDMNNQDWTITLGLSIERRRTVSFDSNLMNSLQAILSRNAPPENLQDSSIKRDAFIKEKDADLELLES